MDIRERAVSLLKNAGKDTAGAFALQKIKLFCWEIGLGPALNALPSVFGQQAVLYFPGRSGKFSLPCCENEGRILLAAANEEMNCINEMLLQSPGIEIWLKSGWYAGTVRLLSPEEQAEAAETIPDRQFFGEAGCRLNERWQKHYQLLEVTRSAPCTGSTGPGSKAWIWPIAVFLLLFSKKRK